ncbi:MAG TPA: DUF2752 domain-containing protein [Balneolaceae bacterium]|nr:DUF2752 domain-containing protein [Balneolaceae bacterium]
MKLNMTTVKRSFFLHFEWIALASGLMLAAAIVPGADDPTFCLFNRAGVDFCPGCGLGRSISLAFSGQLTASFQMHPAGILAIIILLYRIVSILIRNHNLNKDRYYEKNI